MALSEVLAKFIFDVDDSKLKKAESSTDAFTSKLEGLGKAIGGGLLIEGAKDFIQSIVEMGGEINRSAAQLHLSTDDLQRWNYIAESSGVSTEALAGGFKFLQKNAYEASKGNAELSTAFKTLGLDVKKLPLDDASALMEQVGVALGNVKNGSEQTRLSMQILGKAGNQLVPVFKNGGEALDGLEKRFNELGEGLSGENLEAIHKMHQAEVDWNLVTTKVKGTIASLLLPTLTKLVSGAATVVAGIAKSAAGMDILRRVMIGLGVVAGVLGLELIAPFLPFIAGVGLAVLVIDDLITAIQGGDSLIGRFIDEMFGKGSAKSFFTTLREDWDNLVTAVANSKTIDDALDIIVDKFEAAGVRAGQKFVHAMLKPFQGAFTELAKETGTAVGGIESDDKAIMNDRNLNAQEVTAQDRADAAAKNDAIAKDKGARFVSGPVAGDDFSRTITAVNAANEASKTLRAMVGLGKATTSPDQAAAVTNGLRSNLGLKPVAVTGTVQYNTYNITTGDGASGSDILDAAKGGASDAAGKLVSTLGGLLTP